MESIIFSENIRRKAEPVPPLSEKETQKLEEITADFISSAVTSRKSPLDWLKKKLKKNKVPNSAETAENIAAHVELCEKNLTELKNVKKDGGTNEDWLEKTIAVGAEVLGNEKAVKSAKIVSDAIKASNKAILEATENSAKASAPVVNSETAIKISSLANSICKNVSISAAIGAVCSGASKYTEIRQEHLAGAKVENAAAKIIVESAKGASSSAITIAIAGAIKYAAVSEAVSALPKNISDSACANIAFSAVEQVKIAYMTANGTLTPSEAIEKSIDSATAAVGGIIGAELAAGGGTAIGAKIGGLTGSLFGPAGAAVGAAVGGTVGRICGSLLGKMAGARVGQMISYGRKCIAGKVVDFFKNSFQKVAESTNTLKSPGKVFA